MQTETNIDTKPSEAPARSQSLRTCAGCGARDALPELVRVVLGPRAADGGPTEVAIDLAGGGFGRGAHVHPRAVCLERAAKGGLARAFKTKVDVKAGELAAAIGAASDRRLAGLLLGARRAGHLAVGADAAMTALAKGAFAVLVATDAGKVATQSGVVAAIAEGRALAWSTKGALGTLLGRDEVAVCAVTQKSVAEALLHARRVADVSADSRSTDACRVREVR